MYKMLSGASDVSYDSEKEWYVQRVDGKSNEGMVGSNGN